MSREEHLEQARAWRQLALRIERRNASGALSQTMRRARDCGLAEYEARRHELFASLEYGHAPGVTHGRT